jgi:oxidoreductase
MPGLLGPSELVVTFAIGVVLSVLLLPSPFDNDDIVPTSKYNYNKMSTTKNLSAFVVGGSGAVGQGLISALASSPQYSRVTLIGRRQIHLPSPEENPSYDKFDEKIVDFENLSGEAFSGYDVGFCSLGTTRAKSGADGFYRVDHDYVVNTAKLAKAGGTKHFHLVSSVSANKDAFFLYTKTKGEVEAELSEMGFDRLSIYRPSVLLVPGGRSEFRLAEKISQGILRTLDRCRWLSVDVPLLAKVMVANTFREIESKVEILENGLINRLGKELEAEAVNEKK